VLLVKRFRSGIILVWVYLFENKCMRKNGINAYLMAFWGFAYVFTSYRGERTFCILYISLIGLYLLSSEIGRLPGCSHWREQCAMFIRYFFEAFAI